MLHRALIGRHATDPLFPPRVPGAVVLIQCLPQFLISFVSGSASCRSACCPGLFSTTPPGGQYRGIKAYSRNHTCPAGLASGFAAACHLRRPHYESIDPPKFHIDIRKSFRVPVVRLGQLVRLENDLRQPGIVHPLVPTLTNMVHLEPAVLLLNDTAQYPPTAGPHPVCRNCGFCMLRNFEMAQSD
jgi:hypothetical protein